ncbi:MAG: FemAB family PEP-CTERM system-associated protein [Hahellaceae bacterium]|nr:FemAB family PEP-CTERM system-associated protein [Hahellaceae bacterium]
MSEIVVELADIKESAAWDGYVKSASEGTFFHLSGWRNAVHKTFRHKPYYLWAKDAKGSVVGVLPLFQVKSFLFGHSLVSVPFAVYGGALGDTPEVIRALEDEAARLAEKLGVDHLELRYKHKTRDDWPSKSLHATFIRELHDTDEANLAAVKYKQRAVVRKAVAAGFETQFHENVDDFFYAYSTSVRNLGTPVFSKQFFKNLKAEFGKDCEIVSIRKQGELHCALMSFYFKDQVLPFYGGGLPICRSSKAMDYMYFDQTCRAGSAGYKWYDFGRSKKDTGPYNYKRHWGFEPQDLNYQYYLVKATSLPDLNPLNPKYQLMINTWQKLPLWLSQFLGPFVSRNLG